MNPLSREEAGAIYDVLVAHAGAPERGRDDFVLTQTTRVIDEYRFVGALGFGGKFWRDGGRRPGHDAGWRVSCYPEDRTDAKDAAIATTNRALADLLARRG